MNNLIAAVILLLIYISSIFSIKYINKNKICDVFIPIVIIVLYLCCVVKIYLKLGINDWNFQNALPTANVSPFMYVSVFIMIFLPNGIKKYGYTLVASLSLGMMVAGMITLVFNHMRNYTFCWSFFADSVIHMLVSLYGIYLYKTNQTFYNNKERLISGSIIISVALIMLIINIIFDTAFFGLSLNGNHNIYNVVVCKSSILSTIIYFIGLSFVLFIGTLYQMLLNKRLYIKK